MLISEILLIFKTGSLKKVNSIFWISVNLFLLLSFLGCSAKVNNLTPSNAPTNQKTLENKNTLTPEASLTLKNTSVVEKMLTPWPEITIIPKRTSTPFETAIKIEDTPLTVNQVREKIKSLLSSKENCKLPCLFGITPWVTDTQTSVNFIDQFGNISSEKDFYTHSNTNNSDEAHIDINLFNNTSRVIISMSIFNQKGAVKEITANFESVFEKESGDERVARSSYGDPFFERSLSFLSIENILTNYGKPSQILMMPILYDASYVDDSISLVLVYQKEGFLIEYLLLKTDKMEYYEGCRNKTGYISLVTWSPQEQISLANLLQKKSGLGLQAQWIEDYKSIEEVSDFNVEKFYKTFKEPNTLNCIQTPKKLWPHLIGLLAE